jgi:hypothetical protein
MKARLLVECLLLCLVVPGILIFGHHPQWLFPFLWAAATYCLIVLKRDLGLSLQDYWKPWAISAQTLRPILIRWSLISLAMPVLLLAIDPTHLFEIWRKRPEFIPLLVVLYPPLSALPQELVFCSFFFARYRPLFGMGWHMIIASASVFAYAHVLYLNPIAPPLSFLGGLIFATTYRRHGSLALVTLEHGLYGISLFLTGLGWYFFSGAVQK